MARDNADAMKPVVRTLKEYLDEFGDCEYSEAPYAPVLDWFTRNGAAVTITTDPDSYSEVVGAELAGVEYQIGDSFEEDDGIEVLASLVLGSDDDEDTVRDAVENALASSLPDRCIIDTDFNSEGTFCWLVCTFTGEELEAGDAVNEALPKVQRIAAEFIALNTSD